MAEVLNVEVRDSRGKRNARRNRRDGKLPAVLYGHGQEAVSLLVDADAFTAVIRHGARLVKLAGAVQEQAFVRDLQWNTWGTHVLHIDFTRVSERKKVKVLVSVETRGEAPGLRMGGVVKQAIHQVEIECEATSIPDRLFVNINHLNMGDKITVAQMELPPNVTILEAAEEIVVECAEPVEVVEEVAGAGEAEPEVIGRKKEEEGEEEE